MHIRYIAGVRPFYDITNSETTVELGDLMQNLEKTEIKISSTYMDLKRGMTKEINWLKV